VRVVIFLIAFISFVGSWFLMAWALNEGTGGSYYSGETSPSNGNAVLGFVGFGVALLVSVLCMYIPARMMRR
jgi:ABC-type antimicrobial peptide transport system permease subunit